MNGLRDPCLSLNNLDIGSRFLSFFSNYGLRILGTCVSTCESKQSKKKIIMKIQLKKKKEEEIKIEGKVKAKEPILALCGRASF